MDSKEPLGIGLWQLLSFSWISLAGTLLHFGYDYFPSSAMALFSGVNESTWEHMKLFFFPAFLFAIVQSFFLGKKDQSFWCVKCKGILLGLVLIPILFDTLQGTFGKTPDWVNITIFFVSAAIASYYELRQFQKDAGGKGCKWAFLVLLLLCVAFWFFSFSPPQIPLFQDPMDASFGVIK